MWYKGAVFILASVCEENCTFKSSFQICIPISCKSTFLDKNETKKISLGGGNRENTVNMQFCFPVSQDFITSFDLIHNKFCTFFFFFFKGFTNNVEVLQH